MTHPPMVDSYLRELLGDLDVEVETTDRGYVLADDPRVRLAAPGNATHPLGDVIGPRSSSGPEPRDTSGVAAAPQQPIANAAGYL